MIDYKTTEGFTLTLAEREFLKDSAKGCEVIVSIEAGPRAALWCFRAGAPKADLYSMGQGSIDGDPGLATGPVPESWDLVFIDGEHAFKDVLLDLTKCLDRVAPGGLIILHDYQINNMPEVKLAVDFWLTHIAKNSWKSTEGPDSLFVLKRAGRRKKRQAEFVLEPPDKPALKMSGASVTPVPVTPETVTPEPVTKPHVALEENNEQSPVEKNR